jgi:hypothetical protein
MTKLAKCTIDTGNMQGNIVSQDFLENVLEFPVSRIQKLTKDEERGGTGITGDSHIPTGAVYLTWYHKNSTRVFRDVRFLISSTRHCDLIIGARSIQKEKILNVPCLMAGNGGAPLGLNRGVSTKISLYFLTRLTNSSDEELRKLIKLQGDLDEEADKIDEEGDRKGQYRNEARIVRLIIDIYENQIIKGSNKPLAQRQEAAKKDSKWEDIEREFDGLREDLTKQLHFAYTTIQTELQFGDGEIIPSRDGTTRTGFSLSK